jgi:hypothetical protein
VGAGETRRGRTSLALATIMRGRIARARERLAVPTTKFSTQVRAKKPSEKVTVAPPFEPATPHANWLQVGPVRIHLVHLGGRRIAVIVVCNDVSGAMAIQEQFERFEWAIQSSSAVAYAPHLRKAPLRGVTARPVLFVNAKGDKQVATRRPSPC